MPEPCPKQKFTVPKYPRLCFSSQDFQPPKMHVSAMLISGSFLQTPWASAARVGCVCKLPRMFTLAASSNLFLG